MLWNSSSSNLRTPEAPALSPLNCKFHNLLLNGTISPIALNEPLKSSPYKLPPRKPCLFRLGSRRFEESEPPTISSPFRKFNALDSEPPTISSPFRKFNVPDSDPATPFDLNVLSLSLSELLALEKDHLDYVCGVMDCKASLLCLAHTYGDKLKVRRSKPLDHLMNEELKNPQLFCKQRNLIRHFFSCTLHWDDRAPVTCNRTGCLSTKSHNSPLVISEIEEQVHHHKYRLLKEIFVKKLSRSTAVNLDDSISYLHYKLAPYVDVDIRTQELEARLGKTAVM